MLALSRWTSSLLLRLERHSEMASFLAQVQSHRVQPTGTFCLPPVPACPYLSLPPFLPSLLPPHVRRRCTLPERMTSSSWLEISHILAPLSWRRVRPSLAGGPMRQISRPAWPAGNNLVWCMRSYMASTTMGIPNFSEQMTSNRAPQTSL